MRKRQALGMGIAGIVTLIGGIVALFLWRFFITAPIDIRVTHLLIALFLFGDDNIVQFVLISDIMRDLGRLYMIQSGLTIGGVIAVAVGVILALVGWINYGKLK